MKNERIKKEENPFAFLPYSSSKGTYFGRLG